MTPLFWEELLAEAFTLHYPSAPSCCSSNQNPSSSFCYKLHTRGKKKRPENQSMRVGPQLTSGLSEAENTAEGADSLSDSQGNPSFLTCPSAYSLLAHVRLEGNIQVSIIWMAEMSLKKGTATELASSCTATQRKG